MNVTEGELRLPRGKTRDGTIGLRVCAEGPR
jgi:hypothetical protein